ncbi:NIF3 protein [Staphylococcus petrasii]|uniref:GTP cyclohydrolase 1 type 2 homolog n=2 Tax=Staphylococcus petrasii TaxID=1276936 RepID=A0A380G169_9STAP|nr:NIF3 protein [Staphylococcus petrasii]
MMKIKQLMSVINKNVPLNTAEEWDNVGLLIGSNDKEITGILTTLDCTDAVVDQAIMKGFNTIIAHHPLIFKGIKNITDDGYGKLIRKIISNDIQLIALHTNLDNHVDGVNEMLAQKLNLQNIKFLNNEQETYYKVQTYIPKENVEDFKDSLDRAGLAQEGNYEYCFYESEGRGQFKPVGNANSHLGQIDSIEYVDEVKIEFMIKNHQRFLAENTIIENHPYETPVYDFIKMTKTANYGLGKIGEVAEPLAIKDFVKQVKQQLQIPSVRFAGDENAIIRKVAIIGGAGIGFEQMASAKGADIFITGDIKHHDALDAKTDGINLLDINHYSEYVMRDGLKDLLNQWLFEFSVDFKIESSDINTDPFTYM